VAASSHKVVIFVVGIFTGQTCCAELVMQSNKV